MNCITQNSDILSLCIMKKRLIKSISFLGARIHECLESVGLPVYVLSNAGKASLKNLTELASNLQIKDVTKSRYGY